mmetsp:Transcript_67196/g.174979  ORF Transcript_67196/g.174979 Transcript_67196/m.174979 type:complete len:330 (+) Transcript_67196:376-1365(+)
MQINAIVEETRLTLRYSLQAAMVDKAGGNTACRKSKRSWGTRRHGRKSWSHVKLMFKRQARRTAHTRQSAGVKSRDNCSRQPRLKGCLKRRGGAAAAVISPLARYPSQGLQASDLCVRALPGVPSEARGVRLEKLQLGATLGAVLWQPRHVHHDVLPRFLVDARMEHLQRQVANGDLRALPEAQERATSGRVWGVYPEARRLRSTSAPLGPQHHPGPLRHARRHVAALPPDGGVDEGGVRRVRHRPRPLQHHLREPPPRAAHGGGDRRVQVEEEPRRQEAHDAPEDLGGKPRLARGPLQGPEPDAEGGGRRPHHERGRHRGVCDERGRA